MRQIWISKAGPPGVADLASLARSIAFRTTAPVPSICRIEVATMPIGSGLLP